MTRRENDGLSFWRNGKTSYTGIGTSVSEQISNSSLEDRDGSSHRGQPFADFELTKMPTAAIAIAPRTAPVKASMTATSTALGSFKLPLPVTTVSTAV
jgi:hypothetical protein